MPPRSASRSRPGRWPSRPQPCAPSPTSPSACTCSRPSPAGSTWPSRRRSWRPTASERSAGARNTPPPTPSASSSTACATAPACPRRRCTRRAPGPAPELDIGSPRPNTLHSRHVVCDRKKRRFHHEALRVAPLHLKASPDPAAFSYVRGGAKRVTPGRDRVPAMRFDIVVPTTGRPSLAALLERLVGGSWERLIVVDDRRAEAPLRLPDDVELLRSGGRGPAAARNVGWRVATAPWVAFLDDDVLPGDDWASRLAGDLGAAGPAVAASQGRLRVPLPPDRRPTDWERNVAGLQHSRWITADMAVRRAALTAVGGFDERFPRAYREDADLALRLRAAGWELVMGSREVVHPVPPAGPWVSVAKQAGNADDVLMRALHGRGWRERAGVPRGRRARHLAVAAAGGAALAAVGKGLLLPRAAAA